MTALGRLWRRWTTRRRGEPHRVLRQRYERFQDLIDGNNRVLDLIADAGEKSDGDHLFDRHYLESLTESLAVATSGVVYDLNAMADSKYGDLVHAFEHICQRVRATLTPTEPMSPELIVPLDDVDGDFASLVGEKMASLAELHRRLGLTVPEGFIATAAACRRHFDAADIPHLIRSRSGEASAADLDALADKLQQVVRSAPLDRSVARALQVQLRAPGRSTWRYAVRSSALGEGDDHSFAGLHTSLLNVPAAQVPDAYREVLASLFSRDAIRYRMERRLPLEGALMAVGLLKMVPARSSGVVHTVVPTSDRLDRMAIVATWGLGPSIAQGTASVDAFELSRDPTPIVLATRVADKPRALRAGPESGTEYAAVPTDHRSVPSVSVPELLRLGQMALRVEQHAGRHQEVEWALRGDGEYVVLQTRALKLAHVPVRQGAELARLLDTRVSVIRGRGVIACGGVAAGPVHVVRDPEDADSLPAGAVLVAHAALPQYASLLAKACAVVTNVGSSTGHLATVAREYRVPMIVDVGDATEVLPSGMAVTVDAQENVVYHGVIHELLHYHLSRPRREVDFAEFRTLRRLLRLIAPLNLTDPDAEGFRARACRTCHDVVRFAHEMAVRELMDPPELTAADRRRFVKRLRLSIPLDLEVVDLGGGIAPESDGATITPSSITSAPLAALLGHLCASWRTEPVDMDMGSLLASATKGASLVVPERRHVRPNLVVVRRDYANLHLHLGYHFNMVDARLTETPSHNYVYFRFNGGVTELTRRSRRARTIAAILEAYGFGVDTRGDLVIGRLRGLPTETTRERLEMIGRLIGYTRQLDVLMRDDGSVRDFAREFCKGSDPLG